MSPDEYWRGDCSLTRDYLAAYEWTRQRRNQEFWVQGMYIYDALLRVSPILNAFAKAGTKPKEYVEEPYPLTSRAVADRNDRKAKSQYNTAQAAVTAWAVRTNRHFEEAKAQNGGQQ